MFKNIISHFFRFGKEKISVNSGVLPWHIIAAQGPHHALVAPFAPVHAAMCDIPQTGRQITVPQRSIDAVAVSGCPNAAEDLRRITLILLDQRRTIRA